MTSLRDWLTVLVVALGLACVVPVEVRADDQPLAPSGIQANVPTVPSERLHRRTHFGDGPLFLPAYQRWKNGLLRRHRFSYAAGIAPLVQLGTEPSTATANWILDVAGTWTAFETGACEGSLHWVAFGFWTLGERTTTEFADRLGLASRPNNRDTEPDDEFGGLPALYWQQSFRNFGFRVGQLDATALWATSQFLSDDNRGFVAQPLVTARGALLPEAPVGLGFQASMWSGRRYLAAGIQDDTGNQETPDFDSLLDGGFSYFAEIGWEPHQGEEQMGAYRFTYQRSDALGSAAGEGVGHSIIATAEQRIRSDVAAFARLAYSWGRVPARYERTFVAGLRCQGVGRCASDEVGLAAFWLRPGSGDQDEELGLESFWRLQLTQRGSLTPNIQVFPVRSRASGAGATFGLRLRWDF